MKRDAHNQHDTLPAQGRSLGSTPCDGIAQGERFASGRMTMA